MTALKPAARRLGRLMGCAGFVFAAMALFLGPLSICVAQDAAGPTPQYSAAVQPSAAEAIPDFLRPVPGWDATLDRVERLLGEPSASDNTLAAAREDITRLQDEIEAHLRLLQPRLAVARAQAEKFGPAPGPGQPMETTTIAQQRSTIAAAVTGLTGGIMAAEAAILRAEHLAARVRDIRRQSFQDNVLQRGPSALSAEFWGQVAEDIPAGLNRLDLILGDWQAIPDLGRFTGLVLAAIALWAALSLAAWRGILRYRRWHEPEAPSDWRRVSSAGWVILLRTLPAVAAGAFIIYGIENWDLLPARTQRLVDTALFAIMIVAAVEAVSKTVLAINRPHWRLLRLSDEAACKLYHRTVLLAVVYGSDRIASAVSEAANMPFSLSVAQSFVASIAYAAFIISILRIQVPAEDGAGRSQRVGRSYVRLPLWLVAIAIFIAAVTGYVALARFIAGQLIVISTILTIAYLFIVWASAFGDSLSDDRARAGQWMRDRLGLEKRRREQVALPITLLLQSAILVAAIPFILLQWGFDWQDIGRLFQRALFGFDIGSAHISITTVVAALLLFTLGYIAAKIFQGWLDSQILEPAGVDDGVRNSIRTGVGYLGVVAAALLAISYAGLDFSNLAIVAGALSVGIGFGLQSVVNNFVSGLILLAERPIKVGDWVMVGVDEGIVRRISVRSTEIETFERSNVIVPNSLLISQKVTNWTLHNNTGRFAIRINVHYKSDPEQVRDILLQTARAHPQLLSTPEPFVFFEEFGAHALHFILYVYLSNVASSHAVRTDLRIAILKAFRAAHVEIPYPQTDVHFRDLQWVKRAITDRLGKQASDDAMTIRSFDAESGLAEKDNDNGD